MSARRSLGDDEPERPAGALTPDHRGRHRRGVLLLNLGTPDRPDIASVRRYLRQFLSDPEVIRLPRRLGWMNKPLAAMIAQFRGPQSAEAYRSIWTDRGSPLKVLTEQQVTALQSALPGGWSVFHAMRYGNPSCASALRSIAEEGIDDLVVIPMYPHFSGPTTGTALDNLYEDLRTFGRQMQVTVRSAFFDDVGYVEAQARLIHGFSEERSLDPADCVLVYSAHSMPESYIRAGDPYQDQVLHSVDSITERLGWPRGRMKIAYQSKLGPVPWLAPSTEQMILDLAAAGEPNILVCPISFTADCLETLEEIDIRYRRQFEASGGRLHLCPALNAFEPFIKTLSRITLRGSRPTSGCQATPKPLMTPRPPLRIEDAGIESLLMIGTSLPARLGNGVPTKLRHVTPEQFRQLKRPQEEVPDLLHKIRETNELEECWLWNTCSRFELYGWVAPDNGTKASDRAVTRATEAVAGVKDSAPSLNVLRGRDALHHLLRTAAGLNSGLPGDGEVVRQMEVAHELARRCEIAGPRTARLREDILACLDELNKHTAWGRFQPDYCTVALKRIALDLDVEWLRARCVIIGGSVTALSTVTILRDHFQVPSRQITVAYRNHKRGKLMKQLRAAVGDGVRIRLDTYADARLRDEIADADVIVFALDSRRPVIDLRHLGTSRDFTERPLTILDFNTFRSTDGAADLDGVRVIELDWLDRAVAEFSDNLLECPAFVTATEEAETGIRLQVGRLAAGNAPSLNGEQSLPCLSLAVPGDGTLCPACPCSRLSAIETCPQRLLTESIAS